MKKVISLCSNPAKVVLFLLWATCIAFSVYLLIEISWATLIVLIFLPASYSAGMQIFSRVAISNDKIVFYGLIRKTFNLKDVYKMSLMHTYFSNGIEIIDKKGKFYEVGGYVNVKGLIFKISNSADKRLLAIIDEIEQIIATKGN